MCVSESGEMCGDHFVQVCVCVSVEHVSVEVKSSSGRACAVSY